MTWEEMSTEQRSAWITENVMGCPQPDASEAPGLHMSRTTHKSGLWYWHHGEERWIPMPFTESVELCFQMEDKIIELKLQRQYAEAVGVAVGEDNPKMLYVETFALIHATAEQRCRAAYSVFNSL